MKTTWVLLGLGVLVALIALLAWWWNRMATRRAQWREKLKQGLRALEVGDVRGATELLEEALEEAPKAGIVALEQANVANALAQCYDAAKRGQEAITMCSRELGIIQEHFGAESIEAARILEDLSLLLQKQERTEEAEARCREALGLWQALRGKEHPDTAACMGLLGRLLVLQGDDEQAEPLFANGMEWIRRIFGPEDLDVLAMRRELISLYQRQQRHDEALRFLQQEVSFKKKHLGADHPKVLQLRYELAMLYRAKGDNTQAGMLYHSILEALQKAAEQPEAPAKPEEAPRSHRSIFAKDQEPEATVDIASVLIQLGDLCRIEGDFAAAEDLYRQALTREEERTGRTSSDVANLLNNLGAACFGQNRFDEAQSLYEEALAIVDTLLEGREDPTLSPILNNLGTLAMATGAFEKAESFYSRALALNEATFAPTSAEVTTVVNNYTSLLKRAGRKEEAQALQARFDTSAQDLTTDTTDLPE